MPTTTEQFLTAAKKGNLDTLKTLLAKTPDLLHVTDAKNCNAWWHAYANNHLTIATHLQEIGIEVPTTYGRYRVLEKLTNTIDHHPKYQERVILPSEKSSIADIKKCLLIQLQQQGIAASCPAIYTKMKAITTSPDLVEIGTLCLSVALEKNWKLERCHLQIAIILQDKNLQDTCISLLDKKGYDFNYEDTRFLNAPIYYALKQFNQPLVYKLLCRKAFVGNNDLFMQQIEQKYIEFFLLTMVYSIFSMQIATSPTSHRSLVCRAIYSKLEPLIPYLADTHLLNTHTSISIPAFKAACNMGNLELALQLLDYGHLLDEGYQADVLTVAQDLFFQSAVGGNLSQLELAIKHGCDVNAVNKDNHAGWVLAATNNHPDYVSYLYEMVGVNVPSDYFKLGLLDQALIQEIPAPPEKKVPNNLSANDKKTLDDEQALQKNIIKFAIIPGDNVTEFIDSIDAMVKLLKGSTNTELQPLVCELEHLITTYDYLFIKDRIIKQLHIDSPASFESRYTPLKITLSWYKIRILSIVLDTSLLKLYLPKIMATLDNTSQRKLINLTDKQGLTLLLHATKKLDFSAMGLFLQYGANNIIYILNNIETWRKTAPKQVDYLLLTIVYANLTTQFDNLDSLAHLAVQHNRPELIPLCKSARLPLNNRNNTKLTPLDLAISKGASGAVIAAQLLIYGINPDITQQTKLLTIDVNLFSCLLERITLLEKNNEPAMLNQAIVSMLTNAIIDGRGTTKELKDNLTALELLVELHSQQHTQEKEPLLSTIKEQKKVIDTLEKNQECLKQQVAKQAQEINVLKQEQEHSRLESARQAQEIDTLIKAFAQFSEAINKTPPQSDTKSSPNPSFFGKK